MATARRLTHGKAECLFSALLLWMFSLPVLTRHVRFGLCNAEPYRSHGRRAIRSLKFLLGEGGSQWAS